jgi:hypothetical protein
MKSSKTESAKTWCNFRLGEFSVEKYIKALKIEYILPPLQPIVKLML